MNAQELYVLKDETYHPTGLFYCTVCNKMTWPHGKEAAEKCCRPRVCATCGVELDDSQRGYMDCEACRHQKEAQREREHYERATKIAIEDYDGPLYDESIEKYFQDFDALWEEYEWRREDSDCDLDDSYYPKYVYACTIVPFRIDPNYVIEYVREHILQEIEDGFDMELEGEEELKAAVRLFNERQTGESWVPDYTRVVTLPEGWYTDGTS